MSLYQKVCYNKLCKRQKTYIKDVELAGTTIFLSCSEVYVITELVISRDDLYTDVMYMPAL